MTDCTLDFDFCEHCIYGKHNRVRFASGATRAKGILELIHSDVFGLLNFLNHRSTSQIKIYLKRRMQWN